MFEVMGMQDKAARDRIYTDLRANGNPEEKQAVKWSSVELTGTLDSKGRLAYRSLWFVGHPGLAPATVA